MRIGIVAGESSGDLLGAGLIDAIKQRIPDARFEGVAGPAMRAVGCDALEDVQALAVFGLIEPLKEIPRLLRLRRMLVDRWTADPPDAFVGIDAQDFNLGLQRRLHDAGIRTVQYVSPSVWAWRQGRVRKIAAAVDVVLCLLPFEKSFYDDHDVGAVFVGHPMADRIPPDLDQDAARTEIGLDADQVVAMLPGSRASEVCRLGPVFAGAAAGLLEQFAKLQIVAPMATTELRNMFAGHLQRAGVADRVMLTDGGAQVAMAAADVVLLASGTASLEAALVGRSQVAAYRLAALTYAIARVFRLVKVPHMTLPNLLTREPLVPEFLQSAATPDALAQSVAELLYDPGRRRAIESRFVALREELARGADERAAAAVLHLIEGSR